MSDADLLTYFLKNDYTLFFKEREHKHSDLYALAVKDHIKHLKQYAINGDVRNFMFFMSSATIGYFPEMDYMFPHWWDL